MRERGKMEGGMGIKGEGRRDGDGVRDSETSRAVPPRRTIPAVWIPGVCAGLCMSACITCD